MNKNFEITPETDEKPGPKPDEYSGFCFSSAIKIFDPETQEVLVNIRGDN
jgi:hypothetical protein